MLTPDQIIQKATISLLYHQPFFATLLYRLKRVGVPGFPASMATDGKRLFYNPDVIRAIDDVKLRPSLPPGCAVIENLDQLRGVLCHEALHPALGHHTRMGLRDPEGWNVATDAVINPMVLESGFPLPKGVVNLPWANGLSAEEVYNKLQQQQKQQKQPQPGQGNGKASGNGQQPTPQGTGSGQGNGQPIPTPATSQGGIGQVLPAPAKDPMEQAHEEREWRIAVQEAAEVAKSQGKLPGHLERFAQALAEPKLDWRVILRRFVEETVLSDHTWARPNRRFIAYGVYLPGQHKEGCGEIISMGDASGSIGQAENDAYASEMKAIHEELKPSMFTVAYFDAKVQGFQDFYPGDEVEFKPKGGGGTDFRPIFEWIAEQERNPKAVVILTDLMGTFPNEAPDYPVLWITTHPGKAPFGETIELTL